MNHSNKNVAEIAEIEVIITIVYQQLKSKRIHPAGRFGTNGCWYTKHNDDLISVIEPSRAHPDSQERACRSKKYVRKVCKKYNCTTVEQLQKFV